MKQNSLKQYVALRNSFTAEKAKLEARLAAINQALNGTLKATPTRPGKTRTMSAAARARIGAAQKARWAKLKAEKKRV